MIAYDTSKAGSVQVCALDGSRMFSITSQAAQEDVMAFIIICALCWNDTWLLFYLTFICKYHESDVTHNTTIKISWANYIALHNV